jgi:hypothetical protein
VNQIPGFLHEIKNQVTLDLLSAFSVPSNMAVWRGSLGAVADGGEQDSWAISREFGKSVDWVLEHVGIRSERARKIIDRTKARG